jgi:GTP-binding protein Era
MEQETRSGHVALTGLPNVGKSTLLNALVGQHLGIVSPKPQATRLPVVGLRTDDQIQYIFHDLPGLLEPSYLMQERMRSAALEELDRADVILHLHPAPDAPAPPFGEVARLERAPRAPVITVYTKGDVVSSQVRGALMEAGDLVTSENGAGISQLLARVRDLLPLRPFEFDPGDVGTQPLRFFVEEFREGDRPVYIRVTLYVERETQKAILIGAGGSKIKALGSHARRRLEPLIGAPVYLDCWVKVLPNWRKNAAALLRLGFPEPGGT